MRPPSPFVPSVSKHDLRAAVLLWLVIAALAPPAAAADPIELRLADEIAARMRQLAPEALAPADRAYRAFLLAVYARDAAARADAAALYAALDAPEAAALRGSLELLEARDRTGFGASFRRWRLVQHGMRQLDAAAAAHPDALSVRIVRAISYYELPAVFGRFATGFADIRWVLDRLEHGAPVPDSEPLLRDRSSLFYFAGRYYRRDGDAARARAYFERAAAAAPDGPFGRAARAQVSLP